MQEIIIAIAVLSGLEVVAVLQEILALRTIKKNKSPEKVAVAESLKVFSYWEFAIIMIVKVNLENEIALPTRMPILWWTDMLLMNAGVAFLLAEYITRRNNER